MDDISSRIQAAQAVVDDRFDEAVSLTQALVRIPSVNPKFVADPAINRETDVQSLIAAKLEADGFAVDRWDMTPGRPNLVAERPGTDARSLILCGHVDVVPIGERERWSVDPFGGEIDQGRLYGRGAIDMKGGIVACMAAAAAIRAAGIELEGRLAIHTVVDEEAGGFGARDLVARKRLGKGLIVAEPTWGAVLPAEGGLEWVRVTIRGRSAHAGWRFNEIFPQPQSADRLVPGVNAIELATRFLDALRHYESAQCRNHSHPLVPPGLNTINPGVLRAGAGLGPDGLPMVMTNPAIIPDVAVIDFDLKYLPNQASADIRRDFEDFVHHFACTDPWLREHPPTVQWELGDLHFAPLDTPLDHPLVTSLTRHAEAMGRPAPIRGFEAVCDAAHYAAAGVEGVIFGPSGDGFHGDDEYVDLASLKDTTKVLAATIIDWCGVKA